MKAYRDFSRRNYVVIQDGDTHCHVDVQLGLESSSRMRILKGFEEGNVVVGP
jgi:hypothetical protein